MPGLNASLNFASALFLVAGFIFIRRKEVPAHKFCMLAAAFLSTLFLISYLYYHWHHGSTRFPGTGLARTVYFFILIPHTILAAVQLPLIITTLTCAFRNRVEAHKKWARITWPIWLYVSVTGVVIYWMLYRISWN